MVGIPLQRTSEKRTKPKMSTAIEHTRDRVEEYELDFIFIDESEEDYW